MTQIINALSEVSDRYDTLFVDLWGCVHNGVRAHAEAVKALRQYRSGGGTVVLVTNSPRGRAEVEKQLIRFEVPRDCWDTIATSGDSARAAMFTGAVGEKVYFIGQPEEVSFFEPLKVIDNPVAITRVPLEEAEGIVCTGPFDPLAPPEDMRATFLFAKQKGLKFLCANPDIVVDRGAVREWCGGALAQLYTEMGGESLYFGKPHPPIYDLARRRVIQLGRDSSPDRTLAIGDGPMTDILGAMGEDIDSLFISGGLAAVETKTTQNPNPDALSAYLSQEQIHPTYTIGQLR